MIRRITRPRMVQVSARLDSVRSNGGPGSRPTTVVLVLISAVAAVVVVDDVVVSGISTVCNF